MSSLDLVSADPAQEPEAGNIEDFRKALLAELRGTDPFRNPMFAPALDANVLHHLPPGETEPKRNSHGQPIVTPQELNLFVYERQAVVVSNLGYQHEVSPIVAQRIFNRPKAVCPPSSVIEASWCLASGVHKENGAPQITRKIGVPLQCIDVEIYAVRGAQWSSGQLAGIMQPLAVYPQGALVPLVGSFFAAAQEIAPPRIQAVAFPGPNYDREAPQEQNDIVMAKHPMFLQGGRSVILPAVSHVPVIRSASGGLEVIEKPEDIDRYLKDPAAAELAGFQFLTAIATQYIGVGLRRYTHHGCRIDDDGRVAMGPNDVIIDHSEHGKLSDEAVAFVQRPDYAGKRGIFLDLKHQPDGAAPTGGLATAEIAITYDKLLLAHGAELSGIVTSILPLVTKGEVDALLGRDSGMACPAIHVAARAILDDTHRLDVLTKEVRSREASPGRITQSFAELIERDYGEYSDTRRDEYLTATARIIGKNLAICARLGLTIRPHQPTADNLSIYGRITDSENFIKTERPGQIAPLVHGWLRDLRDVAQAGGLSRQEFAASPHFAAFLEEVYGREGLGHALAQSPQMAFSGDAKDPAALAACRIAADLAAATMRHEGRGIALFSLIREFEKDGVFAKVLRESSPPGVLDALEAVRHGYTFELQNGDELTPQDPREVLREALQFIYLGLAATMEMSNIVWSDVERRSLGRLDPEPLGVEPKQPEKDSTPKPLGRSLLPPGRMPGERVEITLEELRAARQRKQAGQGQSRGPETRRKRRR